jgi:hypothetical protein
MWSYQILLINWLQIYLNLTNANFNSWK